MEQNIGIQSLSRVRLSVTPWAAARQASLSSTNSRSLLKLVSIDSVMPSGHLVLCRPLLPPPAIFPSIGVFCSESALQIRWPNCFSFSISPSTEYSGLISFRMDWLDLLAVSRVFSNTTVQKASILQCSAFLMIQRSFQYMTTGKTKALTIGTFVGRVKSLVFNMLPRFLIVFLPRSERLLILWLQSPSTMILEPKFINVQIGLPWWFRW